MLSLPESLDASRLTTYDLCPRKYYNQYIRRLHTGPKHLNTRFSSHLIHEPLTMWYLSGPTWEPSEAQWAELLAKVAVTEEELGVKANANYCLDQAKACFKTYVERFADDHKRFKITGVENYILDSENFRPVPFGSKPDIMAKERVSGDVWTIELKFSAWDFALDASIINPQFLGQVNNTKGKGIIVNLIQPVGSTKWHSFNVVREEFSPKPAELEEFRNDVRFKIATVVASHKLNVFPKNSTHACGAYGGCFFLALCTAANPLEMIRRMPLKEDPLDYLTGGITNG